MTTHLRLMIALTMTLTGVEVATPQTTGFVNNPTGNSIDFVNSVVSQGGTVNTASFDIGSTGPLQSNLFSGAGITLTATGIFTTVVNNAGPGQIGTTAIQSQGEGDHPAGNYLGTSGNYQTSGCFSTDCGGTLTISFASPALAVGLFTIDLFNPASAPHVVTIEAFTGANGNGTSLGKFSSASFNFQKNKLYFMGVLSVNANIRSVVFSDPNDAINGDVIGLNNILFALAPGAILPPPTGQLAIINYQFVSQQPASGTKSYVTYRADLANPGPALGAVTATLTSLDPFTVRVVPGQGTLHFAPVPANSQVRTNDTFTILTDNISIPFNFFLQWTFQTTSATPMSNPGPNQMVRAGSIVMLDGSGSNPGGAGNFTYNWMFTSRPPGTATRLFYSTIMMPTFMADVPGTYVLQLTVSNGTSTDTSSVTVTAF